MLLLLLLSCVACVCMWINWNPVWLMEYFILNSDVTEWMVWLSELCDYLSGVCAKCKQDAKKMTLKQNSCGHTRVENNVLMCVRA